MSGGAGGPQKALMERNEATETHNSNENESNRIGKTFSTKFLFHLFNLGGNSASNGVKRRQTATNGGGKRERRDAGNRGAGDSHSISLKQVNLLNIITLAVINSNEKAAEYISNKVPISDWPWRRGNGGATPRHRRGIGGATAGQRRGNGGATAGQRRGIGGASAAHRRGMTERGASESRGRRERC